MVQIQFQTPRWQVGNSCPLLMCICSRNQYTAGFFHLERFSNDCRKTKTKVITLNNHNRNRQLHEPITIPCNHMQLARSAGKITHAYMVRFGFGFASHWLKNWRESLKPITKRSNQNHVITFDGHLKTALMKHERLSIDTTVLECEHDICFSVNPTENATLRYFEK